MGSREFVTRVIVGGKKCALLKEFHT